ncbi:MAG: uridine-cytidine kinase [Myxococcaceae bacterium]|nr:uridine-cytidine kinase [Myxococcaceae bacterium]MBH2006418.1 uridine-cytidine kinase [Myxococcaceae bacterium]
MKYIIYPLSLLSVSVLFSIDLFSTEIICITGGSAAGKTTYAKKLVDSSNGSAALLELDRYYFGLPGATPEQRIAHNWDHPEVLDWKLVRKHLHDLKEGQGIEAPVYDFSHSVRLEETHRIMPPKTIVFEGMHALYDPIIRQLCTEKIFIDVPTPQRLKRRIKRDQVERNLSPQESTSMFGKTTLPMHRQFVEPLKNLPDVKIIENPNSADTYPEL